MNAIQINNAIIVSPHALQRRQPLLSSSSLALPRLRSPRVSTSLKLTNDGHKKCLRLSPVCLARDGAMSSSGDQEPLWKSFGKALENFGKKSSVEDLLKQQIKNREYYDEDGSGGNPPGRGGGGGGGGGFGESEEDGYSEILDETIQVVLATLGFIFVYMYIINGAEMMRLAKDYIKFLFGGKKSVRLSRVLYQWERFCKTFTEKKEVDRYWLEKAIINTPTWWDSPEKYRRILKAYMQTQSEPDE